MLFNLGGPDEPNAIQPFLFNLFNDKSIVRLPNPFRVLLASVISRRRAKEAKEIYANIGGGSPLLPNTKAQAERLEAALSGTHEARVFIAMRYWHPMSLETAMAVQEFGADEIMILPLYPQFSSTTTASSMRVWGEACRMIGLDRPTTTLCCYPLERNFVDLSARLVREGYEKLAGGGTRPRVLFTAHGLPESVVKGGDPYQWQVEATSQAIVERLGIEGLDWVTCYQSRVGPLEWIKPSTEEEVQRAGEENVPLVVYPLSFVSEHSETLVELDIEYRELAEEVGVPGYERVGTVADHPDFIAGLARLVREALARPPGVTGPGGTRLCPGKWTDCPAAALAEREAAA